MAKPVAKKTSKPAAVKGKPRKTASPPKKSPKASSRITVAVAGATGLVGTALVKVLCEEAGVGLIEIHGRRAFPSPHPKIRFVPLENGVFGKTRAQVAFCCLGTTMARAGSKKAFRAVDFDLVNGFAAHCRAAGTGHFLLVSAKGASPASPFYYMKVKGEVESALLMHRFPAVTVVRPTLLTGNRTEDRKGEAIARTLSPVMDALMVGPFKPYRSVSDETVAKAMVWSARNPPEGVRVLEGDGIRNAASGL